jgi:hypothetical protein
MVFSLEHDIKVTKNHQNLLPTQSVLVAHTVFCYCGYAGRYELNKIKVHISSSGRENFFSKCLRAALGPSLPRSEFGIRQF